MRYVPPSLRLLILLLPLGLALRPAAAQMTNVPNPSNPSTYGNGPQMLAPPPAAKKAAPVPDALPGAAPRADRVVPSSGASIADPTEALFDAINRGDIATAREAIDRGADLNGHSILGMTPLDLSVDLGRNDITFLLLSLRNGDPRQRVAAPTQVAQGAAAGTKPPAKTAPKPQAAAPVRTAASTRPGVVPVAQQGVGDSGTPNPAAGFLGFGPAR